MDPQDLQAILEAIRAASEPHWLELLAWAATAALLLVAIGALFYTASQVRAMTEANQSATRQARAVLLMELDARWSEPDLVAARHNAWKFMREIDAKAQDRWKHLLPEEIRENSGELYAKEMKGLSEDGGPPYEDYMRLVDYLETLGYVARKGYLPKDDVINLFGGAILACRRLFSHHIRQIQAKPGTTGRAWEHTVWLMDEVRREADTNN